MGPHMAPLPADRSNTITMGYSQRGFYDGDMKWTVEFKKGEF